MVDGSPQKNGTERNRSIADRLDSQGETATDEEVEEAIANRDIGNTRFSV
jgi:hypothetical protein